MARRGQRRARWTARGRSAWPVGPGLRCCPCRCGWPRCRARSAASRGLEACEARHARTSASRGVSTASWVEPRIRSQCACNSWRSGATRRANASSSPPLARARSSVGAAEVGAEMSLTSDDPAGSRQSLSRLSGIPRQEDLDELHPDRSRHRRATRGAKGPAALRGARPRPAAGAGCRPDGCPVVRAAGRPVGRRPHRAHHRPQGHQPQPGAPPRAGLDAGAARRRPVPADHPPGRRAGGPRLQRWRGERAGPGAGAPRAGAPRAGAHRHRARAAAAAAAARQGRATRRDRGHHRHPPVRRPGGSPAQVPGQRRHRAAREGVPDDVRVRARSSGGGRGLPERAHAAPAPLLRPRPGG